MKHEAVTTVQPGDRTGVGTELISALTSALIEGRAQWDNADDGGPDGPSCQEHMDHIRVIARLEESIALVQAENADVAMSQLYLALKETTEVLFKPWHEGNPKKLDKILSLLISAIRALEDEEGLSGSQAVREPCKNQLAGPIEW